MRIPANRIRHRPKKKKSNLYLWIISGFILVFLMTSFFKYGYYKGYESCSQYIISLLSDEVTTTENVEVINNYIIMLSKEEISKWR